MIVGEHKFKIRLQELAGIKVLEESITPPENVVQEVSNWVEACQNAWNYYKNTVTLYPEEMIKNTKIHIAINDVVRAGWSGMRDIFGSSGRTTKDIRRELEERLMNNRDVANYMMLKFVEYNDFYDSLSLLFYFEKDWANGQKDDWYVQIDANKEQFPKTKNVRVQTGIGESDKTDGIYGQGEISIEFNYNPEYHEYLQPVTEDSIRRYLEKYTKTVDKIRRGKYMSGYLYSEEEIAKMRKNLSLLSAREKDRMKKHLVFGKMYRYSPFDLFRIFRFDEQHEFAVILDETERKKAEVDYGGEATAQSRKDTSDNPIKDIGVITFHKFGSLERDREDIEDTVAHELVHLMQDLKGKGYLIKKDPTGRNFDWKHEDPHEERFIEMFPRLETIIRTAKKQITTSTWDDVGEIKDYVEQMIKQDANQTFGGIKKRGEEFQIPIYMKALKIAASEIINSEEYQKVSERLRRKNAGMQRYLAHGN